MTKITIDVRTLLAKSRGTTTDTPVTVNLDELLAANRMVASVWTVEDLRALRPDLDQAEAWVVLQTCGYRRDPLDPITADELKQTAYELYGTRPDDPTAVFDRMLRKYGDDLLEANFIDWLADALHWCRARGHDFDAMLVTAQMHLDSEAQEAL